MFSSRQKKAETAKLQADLLELDMPPNRVAEDEIQARTEAEDK